MEKFAEELRKIIKGKVLGDDASLDHYSKDGSVFAIRPWAVVLPSSKEDIINLTKWLNDNKQKETDPEINKHLSLTCRGKATDQTGGPINDGIIVRFPKFIDKILEIGPDFVRVEPGVIWGDLNKKLETEQSRFIPCYPASANFASIGGSVANNCGGEKTVKYGSMRNWVLALKIILDNGQEVELKELNKDEITKKLAQKDSEGKIYRQIVKLLDSNQDLIKTIKPDVNKISTGYGLQDLLNDEKINLAQLIVGSQGTLGIITEITLKTMPKPKLTGLLLASFNNLVSAGEAVPKILQLGPSAFELVDKFLIEEVKKQKPEMLAGISPSVSESEITFLIEFDGDDNNEIQENITQSKSLLKDSAVYIEEAYEPDKQSRLWAVRRSAAIIAESAKGAEKALPFIEDTAVNPKYLAEHLKLIYAVMKKYQVQFSVWGHAGNGNLHIQPFLDLSDSKDKEKLFNIANEVYGEVIKLNGVISAEHNDGLMRSPWLKDQFGAPVYELFTKIKNIFDPLNIFNPHKKTDADINFVKAHTRSEYVIEAATST